MKTAMQEHIEWLKENQLYFNIPIEVIENAEDLLEKEKEQIIEAYNNGQQIPPFEYAEQYYNNNYGK